MSTRRLLNMKRGGSSFDFAPKMSAYWKLAANSNDSSGNANNGVDTGMVYSGGYAQFGADSKYITVPDSDSFSFTDGTNDLSAHILISFVYDDKTGVQFLLSKRRTTTSDVEWQVSSNGTALGILLYSNSVSTIMIRIDIPLGLINVGELNTVQFQYDGSKVHTGIKAYLNGNNSVGTSSSAGGTYLGMINTIADTVLGKAAFTTSNSFKGKGKEWAIWRDREMTPEEITEIDRRVKAGEPLI